jgi:hypothetical protein
VLDHVFLWSFWIDHIICLYRYILLTSGDILLHVFLFFLHQLVIVIIRKTPQKLFHFYYTMFEMKWVILFFFSQLDFFHTILSVIGKQYCNCIKV